MSLRTVGIWRSAARIDHGQQLSTKTIGIRPVYAAAEIAKCLRDSVSTMGLANPNDPIFALQFQNGSERIRRMQAIGTAKRRVGDSDGVDAHVNNSHSWTSVQTEQRNLHDRRQHHKGWFSKNSLNAAWM